MTTDQVSYRALLAKQGFAGLLLAVSVGRLASGLIPFGLTAVFVQGASYITAGVVSMCFMFITSFTAPWRGRCIDRYSPRRMLPLFAASSVLVIGLGFVVLHFAVGKVFGVFLVCIGSALTPLNSVVLRSIWSLIAPSEAERKALHALDSLLEEGVYVLSPLLVAALWLAVGPDWAILLACFAIAAATGLMFWFGRSAGPDVAAVLAKTNHDHPGSSGGKQSKRGLAVIFTPPGLALTIPMFGFALSMGFGGITFAAWSSMYYVASLTGVLAALSSLGGVVGGLIYGKIQISDSRAVTLYLAMPAFVGLCTLPMLVSSSAVVAGAVAFFGGLVMTPMFIAAFVRVPSTFAKENFNEANASIGSAYNLGAGLGGLIAGVLVERGFLHVAFLASALVPLAAAVVAGAISGGIGATPAKGIASSP